MATVVSDGDGGEHVGRVGRLEVEADLTPGVEGHQQWLTVPGGSLQDLRSLLEEVESLVAGFDHCLHGHPVGGGTGRYSHGVAYGSAAELQHDVLAEVVQELVHLACVNAARCHRHDAGQRPTVLFEVHPMMRVLLDVVVTQDV